MVRGCRYENKNLMYKMFANYGTLAFITLLEFILSIPSLVKGLGTRLCLYRNSQIFCTLNFHFRPDNPLRIPGAHEPPKGGEGASDCVADVLGKVLDSAHPYMEGGTCSGYRKAIRVRIGLAN